MNKLLLAAFVITFILSACKKKDQEPDEILYPNHLLGTWVYTNIENETQVMHKSDSLLPNRYGFTVLPGGAFTERKNSGWCGSGGDIFLKTTKGIGTNQINFYTM